MANGGILTMAFWNGELYAGGDIYLINGEPAYNIARWDGNAWQHLGTGLNALVTRIRAYEDGLYVTGYFDQAGDVTAHGVARWDGTMWHSVFDLPLLSSSAGYNRVNDVAWYNGELYIGGNLQGQNDMVDIARYDGTMWRAVGQGIQGSFSAVNLLEVHDGLLYVAGGFAQTQPFGPPDNPGCGIVTWNGEEWGTLGEGTCGSPNPTIYRMSWIRDTLYVTGRFNTIGGVPSGRVAKWDGTRWCSLVPPDYFYPDIVALGSFRDTLLVGGSFVVAGPDSIDRVAQWVGGNYTSACGTGVGLEESEQNEDGLHLYPNPASTRVTLSGDLPVGSNEVTVHDATGRIVDTHRLSANRSFGIEALPAGCYFVRVKGLGVERLIVHR